MTGSLTMMRESSGRVASAAFFYRESVMRIARFNSVYESWLSARDTAQMNPVSFGHAFPLHSYCLVAQGMRSRSATFLLATIIPPPVCAW